MSGFEIVGVVLGGFPLLVSVADQYEKGFEPLKKWWRFREVFVDFIDAIDIQKQAFDLLLERFLTTAEIPYEKIRSLMTDPQYEGWQDQDMVQAMSARLGPSYDVFMSTIRKMNTLMGELQKSLCLKDGKINWAKDGASRWDYQLKRVRFSFDKKAPKLVSDLEKHNGDLQRLLDSIDKLDTPRQARHNSMWASIFQAIRQHACSLHSAIRYGMTCRCQAIHKANLRLENRKTGDWTSTFKLVFELQPADEREIRREVLANIKELTTSETYYIASRQSQTSPKDDNNLSELRRDFESMSINHSDLSFQPHQSYKMDTEKHVEAPVLSNLVALVAYASHGIRSSALKGQDGMLGKHSYNKKKKSARFATSDIPCLSEPTTKILDINTQALNTPDNMKVGNICSAIRDCPADTSNIGYLASDGKRHNLRVLNIETLNSLSQVVTLDSLLTGEAGIRLSRKERYTIALILASSLLQLQATPWSPSSLSKKNIYLYHQGSNVLVNETYVTQQFISLSTDSSVDDSLNETLTPENRFAVQDSISALGILLLELCFNSPIEAQSLRNAHLDGDGKTSKYTDFMTARDWTQHVVEEDPKMYRVIRACFDTWEERADWGNKSFVNAVYSCIVGPLERLVTGWDK